MASRSWKQRWLFATLVTLVTAQGPALEERDVACKADNLLNKFHNTPAVYIPFCQTYLSLAVYETVTVPIPTGFAKTLFLDNFASQTAGTLPSSAKWTIDTGTSYPGGPGGWGNWEEETYVASTDVLGISSDGTLRIAPKRVDGKWISGRIETNAANDITCPAGGKMRVEASIKLGAAPASAQQGMWPAFWMLGSEYRGNYTNWPAIGEIDMLESVNGKASIHHGVHCGTTLGGPCYEPNGRGTSAAFSRGVFHTVSVDIDRTSSDWKNETMVWKIDGLDTWKLTASQIASQDLWSALAWTPKFILLNVAIGGAWPGYSNDSTAEGVDVGMDVKYVAAWST
ncbi:concanavalin A-like lectin/glucanase [Thozetella sp. PMI_491]|nr:concanavalin A-like lectin/glucanase [Thozetella sp. PMI_491]